MSVELITDLNLVEPASWDALTPGDDPFVEHAFLLALERSGCVGPGTGWEPVHLICRDSSGGLSGVLPLYLKDDSSGEFIFDFGWAEAAGAARIPYYPKLTSAVPFTPVPGRRLMLCPGEEGERAGRALLARARDLADELGAHGLHILFCSQEEQVMAAQAIHLEPRLTHQFRWTNQGYRDFDDYLARFRSQLRKNTRKERRRAAALGYRLRTLTGDELQDRHWDALFRFYMDTSARKWGDPYLNHRWFQEVRRTLSHRVVATLAERGEEPVAGALLFQRGDALFGRYWGATVRDDYLHFELCLYRPLDLCIEKGWRRFEAGAGGEHKLRRGLLPVPTHSAHWLRHPGLDAAVRDSLQRERPAVELEIKTLANHGPFRRDQAPEENA